MSYVKKQPVQPKVPDFPVFHGIRSAAWGEYAAILCGVNVGNEQYRKLVSVEIPDLKAMHYYTRWLQDEEIAEINRRRYANGFKEPIFRVAYHGNHKYTRVSSGAEMVVIEKHVDDGIKGNLSELFQKITSGQTGIINIAGKGGIDRLHKINKVIKDQEASEYDDSYISKEGAEYLAGIRQ